MVSPMNSSASSQNASPNITRRGNSATSLSVPDSTVSMGTSNNYKHVNSEESSPKHLHPKAAAAAAASSKTLNGKSPGAVTENSAEAVSPTEMTLKKSEMSLKLYVRRKSSEEVSKPQVAVEREGEEDESRHVKRRVKLRHLKAVSTPLKSPSSDSRGTTSGSQDEARTSKVIPNGVMTPGDSDSPKEGRLSHMFRMVRGKRAVPPEESTAKGEGSTVPLNNNKEDPIPTLSVSSPSQVKSKSLTRRSPRPRMLTLETNSSDDDNAKLAERPRHKRGRSRSPASSVASASSLTDLSGPPLLQLHLMVSLKVTERPVKCLIKAGYV